MSRNTDVFVVQNRRSFRGTFVSTGGGAKAAYSSSETVILMLRIPDPLCAATDKNGAPRRKGWTPTLFIASASEQSTTSAPGNGRRAAIGPERTPPLRPILSSSTRRRD